MYKKQKNLCKNRKPFVSSDGCELNVKCFELLKPCSLNSRWKRQAEWNESRKKYEDSIW